jgi:hypothetical protein
MLLVRDVERFEELHQQETVFACSVADFLADSLGCSAVWGVRSGQRVLLQQDLDLRHRRTW